MFVAGPDWSGASEGSVAEWLEWLARVRPAGLHVYTIQRQPADARLKAVARDRLEEIAERARRVVIGSVEVF